MMWRAILPVIAVLAAVLSGYAAGAAERYPVWWSPELGLKSLDDIDARLAKPFSSEERLTLFEISRRQYREDGKIINTGWITTDEKVPGNCAAFMRLYDAGYEIFAANSEMTKYEVK